jgi:hypothetical protein
MLTPELLAKAEQNLSIKVDLRSEKITNEVVAEAIVAATRHVLKHIMRDGPYRNVAGLLRSAQLAKSSDDDVAVLCRMDATTELRARGITPETAAAHVNVWVFLYGLASGGYIPQWSLLPDDVCLSCAEAFIVSIHTQIGGA